MSKFLSKHYEILLRAFSSLRNPFRVQKMILKCFQQCDVRMYLFLAASLYLF